MRRILIILLLPLLLSCTKVYNETPTSPSAVAPTTTKQPYKVEFRVFGQQLSGPINVKITDPINGNTLYTGGVPYFASFNTNQESMFLFVEATGFGTFSSSGLQVQIFVNGTLFREAFSQGFSMTCQASGTYRRE